MRLRAVTSDTQCLCLRYYLPASFGKVSPSLAGFVEWRLGKEATSVCSCESCASSSRSGRNQMIAPCVRAGGKPSQPWLAAPPCSGWSKDLKRRWSSTRSVGLGSGRKWNACQCACLACSFGRVGWPCYPCSSPWWGCLDPWVCRGPFRVNRLQRICTPPVLTRCQGRSRSLSRSWISSSGLISR